MKPSQLILPLMGALPVLSLVAAAAIPGIADSRSSGIEELSAGFGDALGLTAESKALQQLASLPKASDRVWIQVRAEVSLDELAQQLRIQETPLARMNDVNEDHRFSQGDWLVIPGRDTNRARSVAALDPEQIRRSAPLAELPPLESTGVVRFGDSLIKLAKRYNLTIQELLRLNPGLEAARLVAGTQVRLARSAPGRTRMVLGLNPVGSGGLSWPDLPSFGGRPDVEQGPTQGDTTWIWPTRGVFTSGFGWRWGRMHKGVDIANNVGTPIMAARSGQVVFAGWHDGGYGYMVEIQHSDGSRSLYAHNSRLMVRVGQMVGQGTVISSMGSTGRSTGPHLHFEIHPPGRGAVNPLEFLPGRA